mgnify:CR=1 FL=1
MEQVVEDPYKLFKKWYDEWCAFEKNEPSAMTLATCNKEGQPSARVVLLKAYDSRGFVFFTNYTSHKAHDLQENPKASLNFFWKPLGKQIRIDGHVEKATDHESDGYFETRSRESQIGAWSSKQSNIIREPDELAKRVKEFSESFKGQPVPRPPFWGGYRVIPEKIEFWQEGAHRLHTRLVYKNVNGKWETHLIYP